MEEEDKVAKYPPLRFAMTVTERANAAWEDGSFMDSVTPTTRALLTYWFDEAYVDMRDLNFHIGQRQAILNTIYIHEVLKKEKVIDVYNEIAPQLLIERGSRLQELGDDIYSFPKYCVKMATGTGKTWVLEALMIWQYLNAKHGEEGNYTKNFLVVAPGLIVYERLLDAFLGKINDDGQTRDFETCDIKKQEDLFLPEEYRNEFYGFLQSSVAAKTEIGSKVTGDGLIAITNFHLLMGANEDDIDIPGIDDGWRLPVAPGLTAGNNLDALDNSLNGKKELEFLHNLPDLMMINDEAHHIHENMKAGEKEEVEWQKSLRYIAEDKGNRAIQLDFSATPYNQQGKNKIYFPHIIVDFDLRDAIRRGLVKTLMLSERKELAVEELDFRAERDQNGNVIDLSEGQRQMLRAGLAKLKKLEDDFADVDSGKCPKMMVVCEDTTVVPLVAKFLYGEGLDQDDYIEIHSNKKGEVGEEEWNDLKNRLFALDRHKKPRVVISVLMLREGFDVNNICVIVPLRSTTSGILLEQTIGRGLRLMWRGNKEIDELKRENRQAIMIDHKPATNYFDVLSIVEHPAFREFYDELINDGLMGEEEVNEGEIDKIKGDLITVGLKDNYEDYDFRLPLIVNEAESVMKTPAMDISKLKPFGMNYEALIKMIPEREVWIDKEVTEGVRAGFFEVTTGVFRSTSYNDYLSRLTNHIIDKLNTQVDSMGRAKKINNYPALSINATQIAGIIDKYIRQRLFNREINPAEGKNWKVLLLTEVMNHIIGQIASMIVASQEEAETVGETKIVYTAFSSVNKITVRENYCLELAKCIYEKCPYPSNKGGFERDFMEFCDLDGEVDALCKVIENRHTFARFRYIREDGMPAEYIPDFVVRIGKDIYLVETKSQDQMTHQNVVRKQRAALRWTEKVNALQPEDREDFIWHYALLGDKTFYEWKQKNMTIKELLEYVELKNTSVEFSGKLF
ncbi:DEAD/DEAH box helicase family protein [Candidatus Saccharibacteria bacterium]|nr:DEAD/DEAH box helicase family protein [Candidatus Saccharibacteria bacterium]